MTNFSQIRRRVIGVGVVVVCVLGLFAPNALAAGNNVGANVANLLKGYASELYGGIVAVISLLFLVNRSYQRISVPTGGSTKSMGAPARINFETRRTRIGRDRAR
jgi:hypothetical protein